MKLLIVILLLIAFLVMLGRWQRFKPGTYDPALVLLLFYMFVEYARRQQMYAEFAVVSWGKIASVGVVISLFVRYAGETSVNTQNPLAWRQNALLFAYVGIAGISIFTGIDAENAIPPFFDRHSYRFLSH